MEKKLLIVGAGGHGKVVLDIAQSTKEYEKICFLDDGKNIGDKVLGYDVVGRFEDGHLHTNQFTHAIIAIGNNDIRLKLSKKFAELGYILPILAHQSSVISNFSKVGEGSVIMPNVVINANAVVGKYTIINTGSIVEHDCVVGDGVHLSYRVLLGSGAKVDDGCMIDMGKVIARNQHISNYIK